MKTMTPVKKSMITAVCIALCYVLPLFFHGIQNAGSIFLPMHIPVLLCGLICGWPYGLFCGIAGPILSSVLTGMPPAAILPSMIVELALYGTLTGLSMHFIKTGKIYVDLYISLLCAMLLGRVASGIVRALIFSSGSYSMSIWVTSYFITSWPGIVLQLIVVPNIIFALVNARLIPNRYKKLS